MQVGCILRAKSVERTGRGAMPRRELTLTDSAAVGLFYIQRYRFLTIDQYTRGFLLSPLYQFPPGGKKRGPGGGGAVGGVGAARPRGPFGKHRRAEFGK